ncbi:MAG: hypothetical protein GY941_13600 [Planctomycetes bacterium]|nr:hypothetical protein [Planctomycetota bacterium]
MTKQKYFFLLALLLSCVGLVVWLFEHKRNAKQFGGSKLNGIGSSFWWSAVTMTTGVEVDFVIYDGNTAIEVKGKENITSNDIKGLIEF